MRIGIIIGVIISLMLSGGSGGQNVQDNSYDGESFVEETNVEVTDNEEEDIEEENIEECVQKGMALTQEILENPNTVKCISTTKGEESVAYLDADRDGECEKIVLRDFRSGVYFDEFSLCVLENEEYTQNQIMDIDYSQLDSDRCVLNSHAENLVCEIYALSLDGEHILIILYQDGPSDDPYTFIWEYDGKLVFLGDVYDDIRSCKIEDQKIYANIRQDLLQTDYLIRLYSINYENKCVEEVEQTEYVFSSTLWVPDDFRAELLKDLDVYEEISYSSKKTVMKPQKVLFIKCSNDYNWIFIKGEDGTQGWYELDSQESVRAPKQYEGLRNTEIFDNLIFYD